jgi:hypothetical protein
VLRFPFPRIQYLSVFFLFFALTYPLIAQVPAPPTGSITIKRLEESSDWQTCGSCGNAGGTGSIATYSMTRGITSPTVDGSSTRFRIGGTHPFKNAYWFIKHYSNTPSKPLTYLKYEFKVYIPAGLANAPQAIEFECQQKAGGYLYNFAWQADYANHVWRTYDFVNHRWVSSGLGFGGLSSGKWHHIVAEFHTYNKQVVHDALTIDGTRHVMGIRHAAKTWNTGHYLSNAFQLDLDGTPTPYHVYVDAMSVTYK